MDKRISIELCLEECKGVLRSLAYKYRRIYNNDEEEAFANACLWLVELYDRFDKDRASFVTYIYTVVENRFINEGKKFYNEQKYLSHQSIDELDEKNLLVTDIYGDGSGTSDKTTSGQKERYSMYFMFYPFLEELDEREEIIFKMFYYNNWSIREIATYMDLSEIRVKELKGEIVKKLTEKHEKDLKNQ